MADVTEGKPGTYLGHTHGGPSVWFITSSEVIDIKMTDNQFGTACDAARTLKARFFVTRRTHWVNDRAGTREIGAVWNVYKAPRARTLRAAWEDKTPIGWRHPVKTFFSDTIDAPVMWALAKGAQR